MLATIAMYAGDVEEPLFHTATACGVFKAALLPEIAVP